MFIERKESQYEAFSSIFSMISNYNLEYINRIIYLSSSEKLQAKNKTKHANGVNQKQTIIIKNNLSFQ